MRHSRQLRFLIASLTAGVVVLGVAASASASSANISQSYHYTSSIKAGSIVSLDPTRTGYVQASNVNNSDRVLGVAVANNDSLVAVNQSAGSVQVATSGSAKALVSTVNGTISVGDQIGASPFTGIGMKAPLGSWIVGLAQTAFNADSPGASSQQVIDKNGKTNQVTVGYISLNVAVGTSATAQSNLSALQRLGKSITGHTVSTIRVVISLVIAFVALASIITLGYASIYGGIISVGRNPLAKYAVFRTVGLVLSMVGITALFAGITIYLILR